MRIGIATPTLAAGDAVGNDALGMGAALRAAGYDVDYFAKYTALPGVRPLEDLPRVLRDPGDAFIYHHSIDCDAGVRAVRELPCRRKVVKYHNVTPPGYYAKYNADVVAGCETGLKQVAALAATGCAVWADSAFNARDFRAVAPGRAVEELPPFHQTDLLAAAEPDAHAVAGLDGWGTLVLCVGRLAPNKNLLLAVDAFADYRSRFDPDARLALVGRPFPGYYEEVTARVEARGLGGSVMVPGPVTTAQLKALYLLADALLVTSDHEGFCVPLVEAMSLRTPVVAVPNAAVPDTAGDAARYAGTAGELAEALNAVIADRGERERQVARGVARYGEKFTTAAIARRCVELFEAV